MRHLSTVATSPAVIATAVLATPAASPTHGAIRICSDTVEQTGISWRAQHDAFIAIDRTLTDGAPGGDGVTIDVGDDHRVKTAESADNQLKIARKMADMRNERSCLEALDNTIDVTEHS